MKQIIKKFIEKSRILKSRKLASGLIIFNYHRIHYPNQNPIFDDDVFGPDGPRFETEMKWLQEETTILSESDLMDVIYKNKKIKGLCSMVTFDDGYADNYDIAYPILNKLGIPAIYFIPTKHINDRSLGWWDIASYIIKNTEKSTVHFRERNWDLSSSHRHDFIVYIVNVLKGLEPSRIEGFLNELSSNLEVPIPSKEMQSKELMTWEQINEVSQNGITIGSHSHEHVILSKQGLPDMRAQIKKSKDILEENLGHTIQSIAYPVGGYEHFDIETKRISEELGFKAGFSFLTGMNQFEHLDPFNIKRGTTQPEWTNLDLPLAFPERFFPTVKQKVE
jgi:peptidoglycan/xylan/chitin deacetylase (PgdA/CDA1 family)